MGNEIFTAIALVLVIEGILPALSPMMYRTFILRMLKQPDQLLRIFGFACLLSGAILMVCVHTGLFN